MAVDYFLFFFDFIGVDVEVEVEVEVVAGENFELATILVFSI